MTRVPWTPITWLSVEDRRWAVGSNPARLVHRVIGRWPGNDAYETACRRLICLHAEGPMADGWDRHGGRSFDSIEDVPNRYRVCLKCVMADETVT